MREMSSYQLRAENFVQAYWLVVRAKYDSYSERSYDDSPL